MVAGVVGEFEQQGEHRLRHVRRAVFRHVADRNTTLFRRLHVDDVVACGQHADARELRQGSDRLPRDHRLVGEDDVGITGPCDDVGGSRPRVDGHGPDGLDLRPAEIARVGRVAVQNHDGAWVFHGHRG